MKQGQRLPTDPRERRQLHNFNRQLLSLRQAAEWGMREIQGSFGRVRIPLPIADSQLRFKMLRCVCRMYQIRVRRVGINHIKNTYVPIWQESDDLLDVWMNWEKMLFSEQRRKDRVSQFYRLND